MTYFEKGFERPPVKNLTANAGLSTDSGNVMIFLFLAIALFGALSFAVTRINRGGENQGQTERLGLHAGEILQYGRTMRTVVQTMQMDGVAEAALDFNTGNLTGYDNPQCATNDAVCHIFHPAGGGAGYVKPHHSWLDPRHHDEATYGTWIFNGSNVAVNTDNTDTPDLVMILPWIKRDLCRSLNEMLDLSGQPVATALNTADKFTGSFSGTPSIIGTGDYRAACYQSGSNSYHFVQVLLARTSSARLGTK